MSPLRSLPARIKSWLRAATSRSRLESEMEAELAFHLEQYTQDLIRRGTPPEGAARRARIDLGGIAVQKEEMRASLGLRLWDDLRADLRYAFRMLLKSPGFTAIAVGSLALGIGANTAIFSVAKQVLLDRLAVPHAEELQLFRWSAARNNVAHSVWGDWDTLPGGKFSSTSFPYPVYLQLRQQNKALFDHGIPIVSGRGFNAGDTASSPKVGVINQALAREVFPGSKPIGKTFRSTLHEEPAQTIQIVGICADTRYDSLRESPPPIFYQPYGQLADASDGMTYEIRTHVKPESLVPLLRSAVQSVDKNLPLIDVRTQTEQIDDTIQQERILADLIAGFGILALTLACIGLYGVMAYTVAHRTNEIGIRLALGAQARQILVMVLRETSWLAGIGVVAGLGVALLLTRFLGSMLFGLKPNDPTTLVSAALLLFAVALLAGFIPARRAALVQPMQALRHE